MVKLDIKTLQNYCLINKDYYDRSDEYYKNMKKYIGIYKMWSIFLNIPIPDKVKKYMVE